MTKIITVTIEVADCVSADDVHEMLCTAIHDEDYTLMDKISPSVIDIAIK